MSKCHQNRKARERRRKRTENHISEQIKRAIVGRCLSMGALSKYARYRLKMQLCRSDIVIHVPGEPLPHWDEEMRERHRRFLANETPIIGEFVKDCASEAVRAITSPENWRS